MSHFFSQKQETKNLPVQEIKEKRMNVYVGVIQTVTIITIMYSE